MAGPPLPPQYYLGVVEYAEGDPDPQGDWMKSEEVIAFLQREIRAAWTDGMSWKKHNPRGTQEQMDAQYRAYLASRFEGKL